MVESVADVSRGERAVEPTKQLVDELYLEEVRRARAMPPEKKLLVGAELFDLACRVTMDGIRHQFPDADEQRVKEILAQRLALARRLEGSR
jgi:hypothetical protein